MKTKDPLASFGYEAKTVDRIANEQAIGPEHVANYPDLLEDAGLDASDITSEVVHEARTLHNYHMMQLRRRAAKL